MRGILCDTGQGIVGIHDSPVVEGRAIILKRPEACCVGGGKVEPLTFSAVEIPVIVVSYECAVAFCCDLCDGLVGLPGLDNGVLGKSEVPFEEHFFPDKRGQSVGLGLVHVAIHVFLHEGLEDRGRVGADRVIEKVGVLIDFVSAQVKVGSQRLETREEIIQKSLQEIVDFGGVELQGTARWLRAVGRPIGLLIKGCDELGVGEPD